MKKIILTIDGMHCSMCESHVLDAIRKSMPETKKLSANHKKGLVSFVVDEETKPDSAIEAIQKEGYKVLSIKDEPYEKKDFFSFFMKSK